MSTTTESLFGELFHGVEAIVREVTSGRHHEMEDAWLVGSKVLQANYEIKENKAAPAEATITKNVANEVGRIVSEAAEPQVALQESQPTPVTPAQSVPEVSEMEQQARDLVDKAFEEMGYTQDVFSQVDYDSKTL